MHPRLAAWHSWWTVALSGATLIALGVIAGYIDAASHFGFEFMDDHYDVIGVGMLVGVVLVFVGCIGWAKAHGKQHRALLAGVVFIAPWMALLLGSPIGGTNIHGPAAIVMMLIVPATILAMILLIMTAFSNQAVR